MGKMRGWGLLLAVVVPLLIFFSYSQLKGSQANINFERFNDNAAGFLGVAVQPLSEYFDLNRTPAVQGQVALPEVPAKSGIKSWALQADGIVLVKFDAQTGSENAQLKIVPIILPNGTVRYECVVSEAVAKRTRVCEFDTLKTDADIQQQLVKNKDTAKNSPPVISADGNLLAAGMRTGSVFKVPDDGNKDDNCGYQCIKPQNCATPRALSCGRQVSQGNTGWFETKPSHDDVRASAIATRSDADKICSELGDGFKVAVAGGMGKSELRGGYEYWVHNNDTSSKNCWKTDYR
jgi:hypothetical protein